MGRGCEPGWGSAGPHGIATNPHWFVWGNVRRLGAVATDQARAPRDLGTLEGREVELG